MSTQRPPVRLLRAKKAAAQNTKFPGPIWKLMLEPNWLRALRTKFCALVMRVWRCAAVGAAIPAAIWALAWAMLAWAEV